MANKANDHDSTEFRLTRAEEENVTLLHQLLQTQEELELRLKNLGQETRLGIVARSGAVGANSWLDDELPEILAENLRLQALVESQRSIHQVESRNALNAKLGDILIQGADAPASLLSVPGKLVKIWRQSGRRNPPEALGGKNFEKIIAAYGSGGFVAVEQLVAKVSLSPAMLANAYTALARHLMKQDRTAAAEAARHAYDADPKPFRLKWLAFRLHEAGSLIEAEAMLGIVPPETSFSDSESRQALQLRTAAKVARQRDAKQRTAFAERRAAFEQQLNGVVQDRDQQSKLLIERSQELAELLKANARLEREQRALTARYETQSALLVEGDRKIDALKLLNDRFEAGQATWVTSREQLERQVKDGMDACFRKDEEIRLLLDNVYQLQDELEDAFDRRRELEQSNEQLRLDVQHLAVELESRSTSANELGVALATLREIRAGLEVEIQALANECESHRKVAEDREREIDALKQMKAQAEYERQILAVEQEVQLRIGEERARELAAAKEESARLGQLHQQSLVASEAKSMLAEERAREVAALKEANAQLERKQQALAIEREVQSRAIGEHIRAVDALTQAKTQLEQERAVLVAEREMLSRVTEERAREVDILKQGKAELEQEKQSLVVECRFQAKVVDERDREMKVLRGAKAELEHGRRKLEVELETQLRVAEDRGQKIESLKLARGQLENEKRELMLAHEARSAAADERGREVETLTRAKTRLEQELAALKSQVSKNAGNRGDADIDDLIGDLELFFNGKAIVYVDVGAYVGDVFLKIKQTAKKFRVHEAHLFEPNPTSYAQLLDRTSGKGGPIVHAYNVAVGDADGTSQFIHARSMTKALPGNLRTVDAPGDVFTVNQVSLDSHRPIFTDGRINLLKIDVEGRELAVLNSAKQLLSTQAVDILYIEVGFNQSGTQQTYFPEIDQFLQPLGYRVMRIYEQKEEWMSDSPLLRRANVAYMSERFATAHPVTLMRELRVLKNKLNEFQADGGGAKNVAAVK
ncbi:MULTISPECIES: FkbM family methyltransferase [unclassified Burkholderia]|uniref:FkbM family methyltransferase n=1 Tax=unclassified Burkholderia TaxID=2613784 RepID=UPI00158A4105|nr:MULTISPECIES: FkbM family methyltransferase [unclassified Burkholderia]